MKTTLQVAWAIFCFVAATGVAAVGQSANVSDLPEFARACVLVGGCSGVVLSKGPTWACVTSASHCNQGNIGNKCTVQFIDGSTTEATFLSVDRTGDFARFAIRSSAVIGVAPVQASNPDKARYEAIGWPGDHNPRVPFHYLLSPANPSVVHLSGEQFQQTFYPSGKRHAKSYDHAAVWESSPLRWAFDVDGGGMIPGNSGCPLFSNGQTIGILSNNNGHHVATVAYSSVPSQLIAFLRESDAKGCAAWNMGNWLQEPVLWKDAPPAVANGSNRQLVLAEQVLERLEPLYATSLRDSRANRLEQITPGAPPLPAPIAVKTATQGATPPPPPDAGHDPEAQQQTQRQQAQGSSGEPYDGHGRQPKDLRGRKHKAVEIDKLRHEFAELEQHQPQQGQQGVQGEQGPAGQDFRPPEIVKPKINGAAIFVGLTVLTLFVSGAVFVGILLVVLAGGRVLRFFMGLAGK